MEGSLSEVAKRIQARLFEISAERCYGCVNSKSSQRDHPCLFATPEDILHEHFSEAFATVVTPTQAASLLERVLFDKFYGDIIAEETSSSENQLYASSLDSELVAQQTTTTTTNEKPTSVIDLTCEEVIDLTNE